MKNRTVLYFDKNVENFSEVQQIFNSIESIILLSSSNIQKFKDIVRDTKPELVIINIDLNDHTGGLKILSWVKNTQFNVNCIMLGSHEKFLSPCIDLGASGFLTTRDLVLLPAAVKNISQGKTFFPTLTKEDLTLQSSIKNKTGLIRDTWHSLSEKEKHVVALKKLGWTFDQIADMFKISYKSVQFLASNVLIKTNQTSLDDVLEVYEDLVEEITEE